MHITAKIIALTFCTCTSLVKAQAMSSAVLPPPVSQQIAAINRGDSDAWLALFPADGVVDDWGRRFVGHDAIRTWSNKEFIGAQGRLTPIITQVEGQKVTVDAQWVSQYYSGDSRFVFIVDGNLVREMRITSLKK